MLSLCHRAFLHNTSVTGDKNISLVQFSKAVIYVFYLMLVCIYFKFTRHSVNFYDGLNPLMKRNLVDNSRESLVNLRLHLISDFSFYIVKKTELFWNTGYTSSTRRRLMIHYMNIILIKKIFSFIFSDTNRFSYQIHVGSTASNYIRNEFCKFMKSHNIKVIGYEHGGERFLFKDNWFWHAELKDKSEYHVLHPLTDKFLMKNFGYNSGRYLSLSGDQEECNFHEKYQQSVTFKNVKNIVYIARAKAGEFRNFYAKKPSDYYYLELALKNISLFDENHVRIFVKQHPKQSSQFDFPYTNIEWPDVEALSIKDTVILFDYFGSGALKALCMGFPYLYLESEERTLSDFGEQNIVKQKYHDVRSSLNDGLLKVPCLSSCTIIKIREGIFL